jgi:hypothetical protein
MIKIFYTIIFILCIIYFILTIYLSIKKQNKYKEVIKIRKSILIQLDEILNNLKELLKNSSKYDKIMNTNLLLYNELIDSVNKLSDSLSNTYGRIFATNLDTLQKIYIDNEKSERKVLEYLVSLQEAEAINRFKQLFIEAKKECSN